MRILKRLVHHAVAGTPSGVPAGRRQKGAAAIEFMLVFPVIFVLSMGVIECGNIFWTWLTVQKAAQAACRFATTGQGELEGNRISRIVAEAEHVTSILKPSTLTVDISSWPGINPGSNLSTNNAGTPCDMVQVKVTYGYVPITPLFDFAGYVGLGKNAFDHTMALSSTDRMVNEPWQPCF